METLRPGNILGPQAAERARWNHQATGRHGRTDVQTCRLAVPQRRRSLPVVKVLPESERIALRTVP